MLKLSFKLTGSHHICTSSLQNFGVGSHLNSNKQWPEGAECVEHGQLSDVVWGETFELLCNFM